MTSYLYNHATGSWDSISQPDVAADTYRIPNLPGDDEQYLEIPQDKANDPYILRTLARYRQPLVESSGNYLARPPKTVGRKRSYADISPDDRDGGNRSSTSNTAQFTPRRSFSTVRAFPPGLPTAPSGQEIDFKAAAASAKWNCDQIRARVTRLIDGGVRVSDFTRTLGVSNPSYYRFMGQVGPDKGGLSEVYAEAIRYFVAAMTSANESDANNTGDGEQGEEEEDGEPPRKRVTPDSPPLSIHSPSPLDEPPSPTLSPSDPIPDIESISLENEATDSYDVPYTADQLRHLINTYFDITKATQAAFLRMLMGQYHLEEKKIQSVQLQRFRGMRGPWAGVANPVYYAAGVFFEKIRRAKRIVEGREASVLPSVSAKRDFEQKLSKEHAELQETDVLAEKVVETRGMREPFFECIQSVKVGYERDTEAEDAASLAREAGIGQHENRDTPSNLVW